jgi:D-arabinose 1-dehydrogenase-like Zn-dependent alcohol dehydrogenase
MKAVQYEVRACGMCRSDWHGWQQNDPDIVSPQIPGHEWAGVVMAVGDAVTRWRGPWRICSNRSRLAHAGRPAVPREAIL